MTIIYHIAPGAEWRAARAAGLYSADSLAAEGFIHLSTRAQVVWVANNLYRGREGLVLLCVDTGRLRADLRYEESEPGQRFPHLYGPLNLDSVVAAHPFPPEPDGTFSLPPGLP